MNIKELYTEKETIDLASYFAKCGIKDVEDYLKCKTIEDDNNYKNADEFCSIIKSMNDGLVLYLIVDCDFDGFASSSIIYKFISKYNPTIQIIPLFHNGEYAKSHGLDDELIMDYLINTTPSILWISDAGSNDVEQCKKLKELGWNILITDHHKIECENPYCVLVNHELGGTDNKGGSGALVTWHMCHKLNDKIANDLIPYVAISLISDSMNLTYKENITFIKWGIKNLPKCENLYKMVSALNKGYSVKDFAFGINPKVNATIRLGNDYDRVDLFYCMVDVYNCDDRDIINRMKTLHNSQSTQTTKLMEKLEKNIDDNNNVIVCINDEKSMLNGLVANKLQSKYNKPCLVLKERESGEISGSTRSPFAIKDIFINSNLCEYAKGHDCSFGVSFKDNDMLNNFIKYTNKLSFDDSVKVLRSYNSNMIPSYLFDEFSKYKYFGVGIEEPLIHIKNIHIKETDIRELGNGTTLKFSYKGYDYIKFFANSDLKNKLKEYNELDLEIVGTLSINEYKGKITNQIIIDKIEIKEYKKEAEFEDLF